MEQKMERKSVLSDFIRSLKYARYLPEEHRRESWEEIVERNIKMHIRRFPLLATEIREVYKGVLDYSYLPSMRSLQFGLDAIEKNHSRIYNCAYVPLTDIETFGEVMFLLLSGCGVGFSVRKYHIAKLPKITVTVLGTSLNHLIGDSIEGWSDAVKV